LSGIFLYIFPLWKRGIEGDFLNKAMLHKISPYPSLPKRGSEGFPTGGNDRPERKFLMIASSSSGLLLKNC
jgi:hypothetical protein